VRVTVKALGDYTARMQELVEPGMPAVVGGPHGHFAHWRRTDRQI
jgi:predicted ferric reductase